MEPTEHSFQLFKLLNGGRPSVLPLPVALIPLIVSEKLGWSVRQVYLTKKDAQKIRHHPMHGMNSDRGLVLPLAIRNGDYYQSQKRGNDRQVEVVLHEPIPKRAYFLVLARDENEQGIFLRTFYHSTQLPRSKMKNARRLHIPSGLNYFKN